MTTYPDTPYRELIEQALRDQRLPKDLTKAEWDHVRTLLQHARVQLLINHHFFGLILNRLLHKTVWPEEPRIGDREFNTMATDGHVLYAWAPFLTHFNSEDERKIVTGILLHELFHVILLHPQRAFGYNPYLANVAMDFTTNLWVNDTGRERGGTSYRSVGLSPDDYRQMAWFIPQTTFFYDERFRRPNGDPMPWEEVYDILLKEQPPETQQMLRIGQRPQPGENGTQSGLKGVDPSQTFVDNHEAWRPTGRPDGDEAQSGRRSFDPKEVKDAIRQAYVVVESDSQLRGTIPGRMRRMIEQWLNPPLPWTRLLQKYLSLRPGDYTWAPGDTRFVDPMPWPDQIHDLDDIVLVIDTSGSMGEDDVGAAVAQCRHILRSFPNTRGWVCMCDAEVTHFAPIEGKLSLSERVGFGGTSFRPPFRFIHDLRVRPTAEAVKQYQLDKHPINPRVLVYFTDGYGDFPDPDNPEDHVDYDVIWVITNSEVEPPKHQRYLRTRIDPRAAKRIRH